MKSKSSIVLVATVASALAAIFGGASVALAQDAATSIVVGADTTFPPFETEKDGVVIIAGYIARPENRNAPPAVLPVPLPAALARSRRQGNTTRASTRPPAA